MRHRTTQFSGRADESMDTERAVPREVAKAIRFMRDNLAVHLAVGEIAIAGAMPRNAAAALRSHISGVRLQPHGDIAVVRNSGFGGNADCRCAAPQ
jgi:hypothetical protein